MYETMRTPVLARASSHSGFTGPANWTRCIDRPAKGLRKARSFCTPGLEVSSDPVLSWRWFSCSRTSAPSAAAELREPAGTSRIEKEP
jgi:hypothetical protein